MGIMTNNLSLYFTNQELRSCLHFRESPSRMFGSSSGASQHSGKATVTRLEGIKEEMRSTNARLKQMRQEVMEEKAEEVLRAVTAGGDWLVKEVEFQVTL